LSLRLGKLTHRLQTAPATTTIQVPQVYPILVGRKVPLTASKLQYPMVYTVLLDAK